MASKGQQSVQGVTLKNKVIHVQYLRPGYFLCSGLFLILSTYCTQWREQVKYNGFWQIRIATRKNFLTGGLTNA